MNGEDRISGAGPKTDIREKREQLYTGDSYEHDARLQRRKIGSLVQSEELYDEMRGVSGRLSRSETGTTGRKRTTSDTGTAGRKRAATETGITGRKKTISETGTTGGKSAAAEKGTFGRKRTASETEDSGRKRSSAETKHNENRNAASVQEEPVRRMTAAELEDSEKVQTERADHRPRQSTTGWKERMQERKKKRLRRFFIAMGSVIGVLYIAVAVYFGFHFYEDTVIYGVDCSQKTVDQVKLEVADRLDEYVLTVECREGKTETISADQIALEFVDNNSIDQMLRAQHCYIWPIMMLLERSPMVSVAFSYDEVKAEQVLASMSCMDTFLSVAPQDAYIGTTDTGFEVVPEVMGTTLDQAKTLDTVLAALDSGAVTVSLDEEDCYVNPKLYSDDEELNADAEAMSELARAYITYDFGTQQEVIHAPVIKDWIVELADGSFVIDDICVTEYVENLAAKYDTFGLPVDFYTSIGTTETLSGGDYGWCIDQDATIVALLNALADGYQGVMEPVYLFSAMSHENGGIGYTYVEICISQQRMWCYENGNLIVDTPVVTGNPNRDWGTPSGGVWAIDAKKRDAILEGEGYEEPVDYWMPFNDNIGIHDFQERYHFGGSIYLSNGSHGCVNTPYDAVQKIFNAVSIGTPVIVYE